MQNFLQNCRKKLWKNFSFGVSPFQALLPVVTNSQACHLSADFLFPQCLCIITHVIDTPLKFYLGQTNSITHSRAEIEAKWILILEILSVSQAGFQRS